MRIENGLRSSLVAIGYVSRVRKQYQRHQEDAVKILVRPVEKRFNNIWYWKEYMKSKISKIPRKNKILKIEHVNKFFFFVFSI